MHPLLDKLYGNIPSFCSQFLRHKHTRLRIIKKFTKYFFAFYLLLKLKVNKSKFHNLSGGSPELN